MYRIISRKALRVIGLTSIVTLFASSLPTLVLAENTNQTRQGLPGRRVAAGSRNPEVAIAGKQLTALVPETNLSLTLAAHPTLFFYVPKSAKPQVVEFVLNDSNDQLIYEKTFTISGNSGIMSVSIPASAAKPLEIGQNYHWFFSIVRNHDDRAEDTFVEGWLKRVQPNPNLISQLEKVQPSERVAIYAANNLWQDALTTLADIRHSGLNSAAFEPAWKQLLQSVKLDDISQEPLLENQSFVQQYSAIPSVTKE
ncbi:MAG: DUF928 domain-containing protein [Aphanothece sp. CMT-3BRIN-NPC111]|jgi:hypothetical protein|nr:DUF928 domain-containing protein [Aphanothece sp. CMT-3BRIN-NPC111]